MATPKPTRPVESTTRVTIAFPFGSIHMGSTSDAALIGELADLLVDLTAILDRTGADAAFADVAARARDLAERA